MRFVRVMRRLSCVRCVTCILWLKEVPVRLPQPGKSKLPNFWRKRSNPVCIFSSPPVRMARLTLSRMRQARLMLPFFWIGCPPVLLPPTGMQTAVYCWLTSRIRMIRKRLLTRAVKSIFIRRTTRVSRLTWAFLKVLPPLFAMFSPTSRKWTPSNTPPIFRPMVWAKSLSPFPTTAILQN